LFAEKQPTSPLHGLEPVIRSPESDHEIFAGSVFRQLYCEKNRGAPGADTVSKP